MSYPPRVPRFPLGLLLALAPTDRRDELEGDLREGFHRVQEADGRAVARRWLWSQLLAPEVTQLRAANRARRPFNDPGFTVNRYRERSIARLDAARRNLAWSWRSLQRRPGMSAIVIVTLAVAMGATTAIFTVVNRVLLQPLPYDSPGELAMVFRTVPRLGFERSTSSYPDFADWQAEARSFDDLAAYGYITRTRLVEDGARQWVGYRITSDLFPMLGVGPVVGRGFSPDDDRAGAAPVAILSYALFESRFGGDPTVLDQTVSLDGDPVRVIGVMPEGFGFPSQATEYWEPLRPDTRMERSTNFLTVIGRLASGHTIQTAQAEVSQIAARIDAGAEDPNEGFGIFVEGRHVFEVRNARAALWVFSGAVVLLLLVACANVANLQLSRTLARRQEIGVRSALGAGQGRLASQLLMESLVLAAIGGVLGVAVAAALLRIFIALAPPGIPRIAEVGLDGWMLMFTATISLAAGVAFGVLPALWGARQNAGRLVREGGAGTGPSRLAVRIQRGFASGQIAIAIALSIGAGLLLHSFARLTSIDPGFDPSGVLAARVPAPPRPELEMPPNADQLSRDEMMMLMMPQIRAAAAQRNLFFDELVGRVSRIDGVQQTALAYSMPFGASRFSRLLLPERAEQTEDMPTVDGNVVSPDYFQAMGIPLRSGRSFGDLDVAGAPAVALVNEALAERFWPGESPVGQRLLVGDQRSPLEVVGIVGDSQQRSLDEARTPVYYVSAAQETWPEAFFLIVRSVLPRGRRCCSDPARSGGGRSEPAAHGTSPPPPRSSRRRSRHRGSGRSFLPPSAGSRCCSRSSGCTASSPTR